MNSVQLLNQADTITPSKIVCVGRNYLKHIEELGNAVPQQMVLFSKPNSAIGTVIKSDPEVVIHYEAEISFMVVDGKLARVAAGLDLTKRDLQETLKNKGLPWERAKAFDGAALFSPFVDIQSVSDRLAVELTINGAVAQHGDINLMIHKPETMIAEISEFMTLVDGDIIMTGTPQGVGPLVAGDHYQIAILDGDQVLTRAEWTVQ